MSDESQVLELSLAVEGLGGGGGEGCLALQSYLFLDL